jgi:hypothetical protein
MPGTESSLGRGLSKVLVNQMDINIFNFQCNCSQLQAVTSSYTLSLGGAPLEKSFRVKRQKIHWNYMFLLPTPRGVILQEKPWSQEEWVFRCPETHFLPDRICKTEMVLLSPTALQWTYLRCSLYIVLHLFTFPGAGLKTITKAAIP